MHLSKTKRNITDLKYVESDKGYINNLYQGIRSRDVINNFKNTSEFIEVIEEYTNIEIDDTYIKDMLSQEKK